MFVFFSALANESNRSQIDNADQVVNDVKQIALPLVSDTDVETVFTVNLTAGPHVLTWKYFKDYSSSSGEDKAFIKDLEIIGIGYADDSCSLCPAGTFAATPRATTCSSCRENTFAPNIGSCFVFCLLFFVFCIFYSFFVLFLCDDTTKKRLVVVPSLRCCASVLVHWRRQLHCSSAVSCRELRTCLWRMSI